MMRIREQTSIVRTSPHYIRDKILDALEVLEHEYQDGEIETTTYLARKRSLLRMYEIA